MAGWPINTRQVTGLMTSYHQSHTEEQIKKLSIKRGPFFSTGMGLRKSNQKRKLLCKSVVMQFVNPDDFKDFTFWAFPRHTHPDLDCLLGTRMSNGAVHFVHLIL